MRALCRARSAADSEELQHLMLLLPDVVGGEAEQRASLPDGGLTYMSSGEPATAYAARGADKRRTSSHDIRKWN